MLGADVAKVAFELAVKELNHSPGTLVAKSLESLLQVMWYNREETYENRCIHKDMWLGHNAYPC